MLGTCGAGVANNNTLGVKGLRLGGHFTAYAVFRSGNASSSLALVVVNQPRRDRSSIRHHNPRLNRQELAMNSTYFGLLAEFGEANIPLERVAPKYFGLNYAEARRRAPSKLLPCRVFRLGGQKSPWLVSVADLAELIDRQREKATL